jgi:hypothetical protein
LSLDFLVPLALDSHRFIPADSVAAMFEYGRTVLYMESLDHAMSERDWHRNFAIKALMLIAEHGGDTCCRGSGLCGCCIRVMTCRRRVRRRRRTIA